MFEPQTSSPNSEQSASAESPQETFGKKAGTFLLEVLQMVVITVLLYLAIDFFIGRVQVESISMLDTVRPKQLLMVFKMAYQNPDNFHRGDIVVFHAPNEPGQDYIKRLVGLPGDVVEVRNRVVQINGVPLDEPYIRESPLYEGVWVVPEGHLFVLGDNRNLSEDSHKWGFLPLENVFGRAFLIYWPLNEVNLLQRIDVFSGAG